MVEHDLAKVGVAGSTPVSRSIYLLLFFIFLSLLQKPIFAQHITLKKTYTLDNHCISPKTLGIDINGTCLLKMPKNRDTWSVPSYKIKALLKSTGYHSSIETTSSLILFKRLQKYNFTNLERIVRARYSRHFPTLKILKVKISPTSRHMDSFHFSKKCNIILPERALRRNRGTFSLRCGKKHYFFKYEIEGRIKLYKANHQIKKDKIIHLSDVSVVTLPFGTYYSEPVTSLGTTGRSMARQNIAKDKIILHRMVTAPFDVRRRDTVRCILKDGPITLEFDGTALQNGMIGDEILIRNPNGRTLRGTIMKDKTVNIR